MQATQQSPRNFELEQNSNLDTTSLDVAEFYATQIRHYLSISESLEKRRREFSSNEEFHKFQCEQAYRKGLSDFLSSTQRRLPTGKEMQEIEQIASAIIQYGKNKCSGDCQNCKIEKACHMTLY